MNIDPNTNYTCVDNNTKLKLNKVIKYKLLIDKLNQIQKQKEKINHEYNLVKEKIDEFEANNLEYHSEFIKIKQIFLNRFL